MIALLLSACDDTTFPPPPGGTAPSGVGWCGVRETFAAECVTCHSAAAALGGLDLETDPHAAVVGVESANSPGRTLVVAGDADGSLLFDKMAGTQGADEGGLMPPSGQVSDAVLDLFRDWIEAGADDVCDETTPLPTARTHADGWAEPAVHGLAAKLQTDADCRTCHGEDLLGGASGVSCDACHAPGWRTTCTYCHGGVESPDGAPPEDVDDDADPLTLSFRAHTTHVTETIHAAWDCTTCHVEPLDALTPGHLFDDATAGVAEVDLAGGLSPDGTYDGNGACSNLYCHGTGLAPGAYDHDQPRPTCDGCHPYRESSPVDLSAMSGNHLNHVAAEDLHCAECHADTVDATDAVVGPSLHVDGGPDTSFPSGMAFVAGTCDGTCHGEVHAGRVW